MPLSNIVFHFWFIVEIILTAFIIIYMYGSNIISYVNMLFDSQFTSLQKIQKFIYDPLLLLFRMVQPMVDEHALFWFFELPIVIFFVFIFEIVPLISGNIDVYRTLSEIYTTIVGRRRNNYNFTETTNNYGNYIPVMLILIACFVVLTRFFNPIFAFVLVFCVYIAFYTTFNVIYSFFPDNNKSTVDKVKKHSVNNYIFVVIFAMVWWMIVLFLFSSSKTIIDLYKFIK